MPLILRLWSCNWSKKEQTSLRNVRPSWFYELLLCRSTFLYFFYDSIYFELRYMIASLVPFSAPLKKRSHVSTFSIIPFTLNCVTWLPVSYLVRHPSKNALISLIFLLFHLLWIALHDCQSRTLFGTLQKTLSCLYFFYYSIYFQLRNMIASLVPFSAPFKKRSYFSSFSIIPFTFNCVTWLPVSYLVRHPSKKALISLLFLLFHLLSIT